MYPTPMSKFMFNTLVAALAVSACGDPSEFPEPDPTETAAPVLPAGEAQASETAESSKRRPVRILSEEGLVLEFREQLSDRLVERLRTADSLNLSTFAPDENDDLAHRLWRVSISLSNDGRNLSVDLVEPLEPGHLYELRFDDDELVDRFETTGAHFTGFGAKQFRLPGKLIVPLPPLSRFRVRAANVLDGPVGRNGPGSVAGGGRQPVIVDFEGATIDCGRTLAQGARAFRIYSAERPQDLPYPHNLQDMYKADGHVRGRLTCSDFRNHLKFYLPGRLYGEAIFSFEVRAIATDGGVARLRETFHTERSGIQIKVTQIQNHRYKCDGMANSDRKWRKCDIYLAVATRAGASEGVQKVPHASNDWGNVPRGDFRIPSNPVVFQTETSVADAVMLDVIAMDADSQRATEVVGQIGDALEAGGTVCSALGGGAWCAIATGAGKLVNLMTNLFGDDGDDTIDAGQHVFLDSRQRWTTAQPRRTADELNFGHEYLTSNGQISYWLLIDEFPMSWSYVELL